MPAMNHTADAEASPEAVALRADNQRLQAQLAALMSAARLNQATMQRFDVLERKVIGARSLAALIDILLQDYKALFELDAVSLALLDPEYEAARILKGQRGTPAAPRGLLFLDDEQALTLLYRGQVTPLLLPLAAAHDFLFAEQAGGLASVALMPLVHHGQLIGSLNLGSRSADRFVHGDGTDFLARQATLLAICIDGALATERLKLAGLTDSLTGFRNRRYFESRCLEEVAAARRHGTPLACLFLDLDGFKQLNDTLGHQAGDEVLRSVAQQIKSQLRGSDVVARYGGEEFVALLPATPYEAGLETAERIRSIIEGHGVAIEASGAAVHVTISIGLSMLDVADQSAQAETLANEMVARADKALYAAKAAGRNRVLSAPELAP